jgi:hypothetical protein
MKALTASQLLMPDLPLPRERVDTPELGEGTYVVVRTLTGIEREQWERQFLAPDGSSSIVNAIGSVRSFRVKLLSHCLVDDDGKSLFASLDEAKSLEKLPAQLLDRAYKAALRLSGLGDDAEEEAEKNSDSEPSSGTGSGSQDTSANPSPNAAP